MIVKRPSSSQRPAGWWRDTITGYLLRLATAAALVIDAVVHLQDAHFYDVAVGGVLTQGQLFRIQSVVAIVVALAVLAWPRWQSWLLAVLVAGSAVTAVVTYTNVDIGSFAGLPAMYEPSWGPPGKLLSAYAEGAGALLALAGLARALTHRRRDKAADRDQAGGRAVHQTAPGR
jgi:MYXO-CTERM domain-containing protein